MSFFRGLWNALGILVVLNLIIFASVFLLIALSSIFSGFGFWIAVFITVWMLWTFMRAITNRDK